MDSKITRRSVLAAGTLSALTTALLGAAGTVEAATPATVVYTEDLAAESRRLMAEYQAFQDAYLRLADELAAQLPPDLAWKVRSLSDAGTAAGIAEIDYFVSEIARHLPGLAPVISMLLSHVMVASYRQPGSCCTPSTGYEA